MPKIRISEPAVKRIEVIACYSPMQSQSGMPIADDKGKIPVMVNFNYRFRLNGDSPLKTAFNQGLKDSMADVLTKMNADKIFGMPEIEIGKVSTVAKLDGFNHKVVFPVVVTLEVPADLKAYVGEDGYYEFFTDGSAKIANVELLGHRLCHSGKAPTEWFVVAPGGKTKRERRNYDSGSSDLADPAADAANMAAEG